MFDISRRNAMALFAGAITPAVATAADPIGPTLEERREVLVAELGSVLQELTGTIWNVKNDHELGVVVMVDTYDVATVEQETLAQLGFAVAYRACRAPA